MNDTPTTIYDLTLAELAAWLVQRGEPAWRAKQIFQALYRDLVSDYAAITTLPRRLREELDEALPLRQPAVAREQPARDGRTVKLLLQLHDGTRIETVLMLYPPTAPRRNEYALDDALEPGSRPRATVCVSTQAGCAFGCSFCATGRMGFERHLHASEIMAQVLHFARALREHPWSWQMVGGTATGTLDRITNIVLMGMGEPLHNYDATLRALRLLNAPEGFNLGARHMTVSTVGLVPAIHRLATEALQVNLAISLHAPNDTMRSATMPVARKWGMEELLAACRSYANLTGRQVTFEYVLLAGINDQPEHAEELAQRLAVFGPLAHVNLIPVNATTANYHPPTGQQIRAFRDILARNNISNSVRAERGDDIAAACGQLRTRDDRLRVPVGTTAIG